MQIEYKEISETAWLEAYVKYLQTYPMRLSRPTEHDKHIHDLQSFKLFAANIWHPIAEVAQQTESEEKFIERATKIESKEEYTDLQFIANDLGEIVSCVLF